MEGSFAKHDCGRHGCYGCGNITPTQFSNGVVSADFNGDGFADVIALNTVQPPASSTPSNIEAYLSTAAGVFAAPVATPDGFNPLYIANADINGDGVMDVVTASYDDGAVHAASESSFRCAEVETGGFCRPVAGEAAFLQDAVGVGSEETRHRQQQSVCQSVNSGPEEHHERSPLSTM